MILGNTWSLIPLFAYVYLHLRVHEDPSGNDWLRSKLPYAIAGLAIMSLVSQFPQYKVLQKLIPKSTLSFEGLITTLDGLVLLTMLDGSILGRLTRQEPRGVS